MQIYVRFILLALSLALVKGVAAKDDIVISEIIRMAAARHVRDDSNLLYNRTAGLSALVKMMMTKKEAAVFSLGRSRKETNIEGYYFPGKSDRNALIIGGMHGSELSSIAVANELVSLLSGGGAIYYNVIIVPSLFPDNAAVALAHLNKKLEVCNCGRYSTDDAVDPNRQMPSPGLHFSALHPYDHLNRKIEIENQLLLQLIQDLRPDRIANLHAIRDTTRAGVYADPRTDADGIALGFDTDSSLAVDIATWIKKEGGSVCGNFFNGQTTALYYKDPVTVPAGHFQPRNYLGSHLPGNRGGGTSLGTWATTAIEHFYDTAYNRPAIRLITVEFPGYRTPLHYQTADKQLYYQKQVRLYASSLAEVFLQEEGTIGNRQWANEELGIRG